MPSQLQRAQPRVKYPVEVRLSSPALDHVLQSRSLNLSTTGILLEAHESLDIGARVVCDIPLPGGSRQIPGLVARVQPLPLLASGFGLGIRFLELDSGAEEVLRTLVQTEPPSRLARVQFEGMRDTWRSQAVPTAEGIRLGTVLSFLRTGCEVSVSFVSGSSRVLRRGTVREVHIEPRQADGIPRLAVHVRFPREREPDYLTIDAGEEITAVEGPPAPPRTAATTATTIATTTAATPPVPAQTARPDAATPRPAPDARTALEPSDRRPLYLRGRARLPGSLARRRDRRRSLPTRITRALRLAVYSGAGLALVAFGSMLARWTADPPPPAPAPRDSPSTVAVRPAAPAAGTPGPRPIAPPAGSPATSPATPAAPPVSMPVPPPTPRIPHDPATGLPILPSGTPGPTITYVGRQPPAGGAGSTTREIQAEIPFAGSAEGAIHYVLEQPRGVAINLPQARSLLPLGRHNVQNEGFRHVWIRQQEQGGIQVRFMFAYRTPQFRALELDEGVVRVRVAPLPPETR
jgi:hypothetical protein